MRTLIALVFFVLGCAGETADHDEAVSAPTPIERPSESSTSPPTRPVAPSSDAAPSVDLLHAVPVTVVVSSVYRDEPRQAARLVDGDVTSAWNSRTGDIVGAWVEVHLPDDASVREVWLTVGFARPPGATDLFTANHRVAEVRIARGADVLGTFPLDVETRALQRVAVSGGGGVYRITITRVTPGTRSDWREAIISELRVMGSAPGARAGAHTPTVRVAEAGLSGAGAPTPAPETPSPALAAPVPALPMVSDAAYVSVRARGLARLTDAGTDILFAGRIADFALGAESVHVLSGDGRHLFVLAGGELRERPVPAQERFSRVALAPDGAPVLAGAFGIWRWRQSAWSAAETMDTTVPSFEAQQPQRLEVGPDGTVWVLGQHSLFRGRFGRYSPEFLPTSADANEVAVAVGPTGVVAAANARELFIRDTSWRRIERPLGDAALREVTVGPDGTVVAGAYDGVVVVPPGGDPRAVPLADAGIITALARDARGRTFVGSTGGLFVLAPDQSVAGRFRGLPGFEGTIDAIEIAGRGPELPPPPP